jgi:hypothetical protein
MGRFSESIGVSQPRAAVQVAAMDAALRNALWNVVMPTFLSGGTASIAGDTGWPFRRLWDEFFHSPIDTLPFMADAARAEVRTWYFETAQWWQVYDFLQFAADFYPDEKPSEALTQLARGLRVPGLRKSPRDLFTDKCNVALEREMAGYRFVGGTLVPLSDEAQLAAISAAMTTTSRDAFAPARSHLAVALRLLGDRQNPSYRNVIKEAISAVEAAAQVVAGAPNATLGDALKRIDGAVGVHAALNQGFQKIYGYTSDADGIRHALSEEDQLQQEDALFMLVSCSAFISYLVAKAIRAGIT